MADAILAQSSKTQRDTIIYGLCDPSTGELRYVGKTSIGLQNRLKSHVTSARSAKGKTYSALWVKSLIDRGCRPEIFEIEFVPAGGDWQESERHWIAMFRYLGARLANITDGGEGLCGAIFTADHRRKLSESQKGRLVSMETRLKISAAGKGRPIPAEAAAKSAATRTGMKRGPCSEEHKAKMSELHKGKPGHKHTEESKLKISMAHKGRKLPDWQKKVLTDANIMHRERISLIMKQKMRDKWVDPAYRSMILASRKKQPAA
ncbi:MAG: NUMOD3 domain-containing DNA-binding protein [Telluria sp.]